MYHVIIQTHHSFLDKGAVCVSSNGIGKIGYDLHCSYENILTEHVFVRVKKSIVDKINTYFRCN